MNSDNLKNNLSDERENLSADEQKICNLIGKLDRVDCPKDFDFHLKARIANADKKDFQPSIWQTLRYILPATAAVLIAAFVMIQAGMFSPSSGQQGNEIVAANPNIQPFDSQPSNAPITSPSNSNLVELPVNKTQTPTSNSVSNTETALKNPTEKRNDIMKTSKDDEPTMYRDFSVRPNRKPIFPSGINPNQTKPQKVEDQNFKSVSTKEFLNFIGMETEFVGGKIKVRNVRENSLAANSGVKTGDLIEAVDDVKPDEKNQMLKSNSVKKITVSRDGKAQEIRLKTN